MTLKRNGKVVGRGKATIKRDKTRSVEVALNKRGRRVLSRRRPRQGARSVSKDKQGNGWRSTKTVRVALALHPRVPGGPLHGPARPAGCFRTLSQHFRIDRA